MVASTLQSGRMLSQGLCRPVQLHDLGLNLEQASARHSIIEVQLKCICLASVSILKVALDQYPESCFESLRIIAQA